MIHRNSKKSLQVSGMVLLALAVIPLAVTTNKQADATAGASLELTPETDSNFTGEEHTVTATVMDPFGPVSGVQVDFVVSGANSASGSDNTDASGQATFTYTGENIGDDTITASATVVVIFPNEQTLRFEVSDKAEKHWSMFVIPESPIGVIALTAASLAALGGFMFWKSRSSNGTARLDI
jgi:hypothetical protein